MPVPIRKDELVAAPSVVETARIKDGTGSGLGWPEGPGKLDAVPATY